MALNSINAPDRKTIGVFLAQIGRTWGLEYLSAITASAREADVNLICFVGGKPIPQFSTENDSLSFGIYDLAQAAPLAGILLAADLGHGLNPSDLRLFSRNFQRIPLVATALEVNDLPCVVADNTGGMRQMVRHLITVHGAKRIAFIGGPKGHPDAQERLEAYRAELKANGLLYDESLVVTGDFSQDSGHAAARLLLEERQLRLDAISAANDQMAFGAMEALHLMGYLVPGDIAVTGFDDVPESRALGVPLTTVRQSFTGLGKTSFEMLLKLIAGEQVPARINLPVEPVIRWSCGCQPASVIQAEISKEEVARTGRLENKQEAVLRALIEVSGAPQAAHPTLRSAFSQVWNTFLAAMRGTTPSGDVLRSFEEGIRVLQSSTEDATDWHNVLSTFRRHALAGILDKDAALAAENLFQQMRLTIGELSQRLQAYKRLELERQEHLLQEFGFAMAPAMRLSEIGAAISRSFPALGIERLFVLLGDTRPPSSGHQVVLAYEQGSCSRLTDRLPLAAGHLIPPENLPADRRYTALVLPLSLAQNHFGYLWMEMQPGDWEIFPRVRNLLSSALLRSLLVDQRETAQHEVERLLQEAKERARELDQLYQHEQERRKDADSLSKAARHLSSVLNVEQVPEQILKQLALVLPHERGALMMETPDGTVRILARRGFPDDERVQELRVPISAGGVYDQIAASGEALIIDDVTDSAGWTQVDWLPLHHSWLGVPLFAKNRVIGMLSLTRAARAAFNTEDVALASTFAMQAAISMQNARLYDDQNRLNELMERMVTERVEELHNAYATLEKLDKNKTSFISIAAHELRTPITVMKGYLGMLRSDPLIGNQQNLLLAVDGVMKGTDRLHQIINTMLDVAQLENQTIVPHIELTQLGRIFKMVHQEYRQDLETRQITLTIEDSLYALPQIIVDPLLLHKALDALVVNAIKFTPDGGTINISGAQLTGERQKKWVEIRIRDTGIGIDPANHKVIFEKMHQIGKAELHSSGRTKFKGGGPGLGLALAAGIVKAHEGKLWVESPGHDETTCPGSTFILRLPLLGE